MEGGPPCFRQDSTCPGVLRYGAKPVLRASGTGLSPPLAALPRAFPCASAFSRPVSPAPPYNPADLATRGLGSSPFARRYWGNLFFDFFSCWYLDGSLPSVSRTRTILFMHVRQSSRLAGYPIRTSGLRRIFAPTPGFSQLVTSFFAWQLLGILRGPFLRLTILSFQPFAISCQAGGLEPPTPGLQSRCSSQLSYAPGLLACFLGSERKERVGRNTLRASSFAGLSTHCATHLV